MSTAKAVAAQCESTLALDVMRSCSIKHGMASVIFSLEMSKSEIVMWLLSAEARIKLAQMRAGRMSDDDWTRMARRMGEITEAPQVGGELGEHLAAGLADHLGVFVVTTGLVAGGQGVQCHGRWVLSGVGAGRGERF